MTTPFIVTLIRTKKRPLINGPATGFRKFQREYFGNESIRLFVIEWLLFALLAAVSSWPIFRAIEALRLL